MLFMSPHRLFISCKEWRKAVIIEWINQAIKYITTCEGQMAMYNLYM